MDIRIFELPPIGTNAYLLADQETKKAMLIDAPASAWETVEPILEKENYELEGLFMTHGHWDHTIDTALFRKAGYPVYAHEDDREWIENPSIMGSFLPAGVLLEATEVSHIIEHGQVLKFLGQDIEVRHVPGHAPGSVLFYFPKHKCAVVGDAIFAGSVGRTDLPGGDWETLARSIKEQIFTLPEDTVLYPGHGPATSVGKEKATNPFLQGA